MTQAVQNNEGRLYEIKEIIRFIFLANYFIFFSLNCLISFLNFAFSNKISHEKPKNGILFLQIMIYNFQILKP